ncbi:GA-like domain-containing protein [Staphylococcus cohnii]|uniref:GA-like domain-containing protein n=2 Tax=Staphylococcus cohnii TaxID=29382 RepID=UPI00374FBB91
MRIFKEYMARKNNRYSIRKFTVGTASVLLGSFLVFNHSEEAQADTLQKEQQEVKEILPKVDIENTKNDSNFDNILEKEKNNDTIQQPTQAEIENKEIEKESISKDTKLIQDSTNITQQQSESNANAIVENKEQPKHSDVKESDKQKDKQEKTPETIKNDEEIKSLDTEKTDTDIIPTGTEKLRKTDTAIKSESKLNENERQINQNLTSMENRVTEVKVEELNNNIEKNEAEKSLSTNEKNLKNDRQPEKQYIPKTRVVRSIDRNRYYNGTHNNYHYFGPRLSYNSLRAGDNITTAFNEVEKNRTELTEEERKLFLRNIIRQTSLKNNKSAYDRIFNRDYSVAGNRKLTANQAKNINELLYKMKNLTVNRDNPNYQGIYTFTNQNDVTKNDFGIVKDEVLHDGDALIATMELSKEKGRGTYRFENYAIRPNDSLNKKIKKVIAVYEGRQRIILQQDHLGYYSYTRPDSGRNGDPDRGGGSGGTVKFYISFDANQYIDVNKDKLFGYILSDTLDPNVLRGVNITNKAVNIQEVADTINEALKKAKIRKVEDAIEAATQLKQQAETKLVEVTRDQLVTPTEKAEIDKMNVDIEKAKSSAMQMLNALPDGITNKDVLRKRINDITPVTSPEVNDADSNGVLDAEQLSEASQAVANAEQAKAAVDTKLTEVNSDSLVTPNEKAAVDKLIQTLEAAKQTAKEKLDNVADIIAGKTDLQTRLNNITSVTSPEVNDVDSNGVLDTEQLSEASAAVSNAEQAKTAVDTKVTEITADGLVTPDEKTAVDALIQTLETAKQTAKEKLDSVPSSTAGKDELQTRLDNITSVTSPEVNDADSNGVLDTEQLSEAEQAVVNAEQAKTAVDNKLADVTSDGLVTPDEKSEVDQLIQALVTAKQEAKEKLDSVPNGTAGKDELQTRSGNIASVVTPEVNDADSNGVLDTEQLSEAEQAVTNAEQAKTAVDTKLTEIIADGLVTPEEKVAVDQLTQALETAKQTAKEKLDSVPNGTAGKGDLQIRLDNITSVTSPEVNDADSNGMLDTDQLSEAEQAVTNVEQAKVAVDNKLADVTSDGLVTPDEKSEVDVLIQALDTAKQAAQEKLDSVPNSTVGKTDLQTRFNNIASVVSPEVNDADSNGVLDTEQLSEAEQAVSNAEQAKRTVDTKLANVTTDGLITADEKAEVDALIQALETAKQTAKEKLDSVPSSTAGKDALQTRLDNIAPVTSPEVNDADSNGVLDTEQLSEAEKSVTNAEQTKSAVDTKLAEITADGLVTPDEKSAVDQLIQALETAKQAAKEKLDSVPRGTVGKDALQTRLDNIAPITSPEVNDADSNGVLDIDQLSEVSQAVANAEQAKTAVDTKVTEITADGLVTPDEKAAVDALIQTLVAAKQTAKEKLDSVPSSTTGKDELQRRLDNITSVTSPEVNDADSNGVLDTEQLSEVSAAVSNAEQTKTTVDNKLADVTSDGLVTPDEKSEVDVLIQALETAKQEAKEKLDSVPNGTAGKDELQTRLDNIASVVSPEVNDADGNGVLDTDQLSEAEQAVANAEQAKMVVDTKLAEVTVDGLVTPDEKSAVDQLIQALESAKQLAKEKVDNVPNSTAGKDALQTRLDNIASVTSPEVNDADSNGVLDTDQLSEAEQAVANAEQAKTAVDTKVTEITADGLVTPDEKSEVDQLIQVLESAKQLAKEKVDSVPNSTAGKTDLQTRLDNIASVVSPEVNDADGNGVLDTDQLSEADQAVSNAEQAKVAVESKVTEVTADGLVTPDEKAAVDALIQTLEAAKQTAQEKLAGVPNSTVGKDGLQARLDNIASATTPEVNDADGNGVLDIDQLSEATQAVTNVEQAKTAVDTKLADVTSDGLVTPNEKAEVDVLIQTLETAKQTAKEKLDSVPNGTAGKDDLQTRLDNIASVVSPEVNDADSNGVLDTDQLSEAEQAVASVEQAKTAVDNKLADVTSDGLVTPDEKAAVDQLIQTLETAKQAAKEKLAGVPNSTAGKTDLQTRLNNIASATSPEVNDTDSNGVLDTDQLSEAEQAVANAEQAKTAVDTKVAEVTADGLVTPDEKASVDQLIQALDTAKQEAKEKLDSVPNGTAGKTDLKMRFNNIASVVSPEVNDADSNGVLDTDQLSEASQAVANAEQAKRTVDTKLSEVIADGLVTPDEKSAVDQLIQALDTAKQAAKEKLDSVPNGTVGKTELETRLNNIVSVVSPEVNDADSNGVLDTEQLSEADQAVSNAEQAKTAVDTKLTEITSDGLVTSDDKAKVDALIQTLETAKQEAKEKLDSVPNGTVGKTELETRLNNIASVTSPEVTDVDSNGVLDTDQLSEASAAVSNAEQAKAAIKSKVTEVTADGLITPEEKAEVEALIQTLVAAKQTAKEKLDKTPDGTAGKDELQTRLNNITSVTSPEINDVDSNGVLDTDQLSEASQAVANAEQAKTAVDNKVTDVTSDGLITPDEKSEVELLIQTLETAKQTAKEKLDNVPNGTVGKTDLQTRLDNIASTTLPEVNDADGNGVLDTEQLSEAEQAVASAEQAKTAVDTKLTDINADGLVTLDEKSEVDALIQALESAKQLAKEKVDSVPNGTTGKTELQIRLNNITSVTSPEVNDADSNGVLDTEQLSEATEAVTNAELAKTAVDTKLTDVTSDGLVTPDEKAEVDELIQALEAAKQTAKEKLDNVPNSTAGKNDLKTRLDNITSVTSPEVNDADSNGVLDTDQLSEATQAVMNAEQAKTSVDTKLTDVTSDGLVTPDEKSEVDELIQALEAAKQTAQEKVNSVPSGTTGKDALQRRLDNIISATSPEINDADSNGVLDTDQLSEASQAAASAEQAKTVVDSKLAEVTVDGLVTPDERAEVDALIQALESAKQTAQEKVNSVPSSTPGKTDLQTRLDNIASVTSPEVNDADSNGVLDTEQLSEADQAVTNAEQAKTVVDSKLAEVTVDGLVTPDERAEVDALIQALESAKQTAQEKLNNVPNGTAGKDDLQTRLDNITSVTSPDVNDADSNGVLDTDQLSEATQAVMNAEQAKASVDNKLTDVTSDGLVTQDEKAELDTLIQTLETAKQTAKEKVDNVPNSIAGKADLQMRLDNIASVVSPEVNDADGNGVLDTEQLSEADQAVANAEQAKMSVDTKVAEVTTDGLVTPDEKAEVEALIQALENTKQAAKEKLDSVPNGTAGKDELQTRLDNIASVTSPEVNDADGNGVLDTDQLSEASQAVANAEQAKTVVDTKLVGVTSDGLLTPDEKSEVDALIQALESAKQTAQEKLDSVPNGTAGKDDLQTRLDNITSVTSPEVNDADSNGVLDTNQLSEAEQAVTSAEQAKTVVDNKLADVTSDGLVTPDEKAEVEALIQTLVAAKQTAKEKLDKTPDGTAGKDELQTRLNNITSVTSPEINDVDSNGVLDTDQLSEASQAVANAEQAKTAVDTKVTEITADGLITSDEKAAVEQLIQTLETAKQAAQEKLDNVPNGTVGKTDLQTRLDNIASVTSPEVNDTDSNGVLDTDQLSEATQAMTSAEQAKTAVDNKLADVTSDGLVTPDEKASVDQILQTLEDTKQAAQEKLNNVPNGIAGKDDLQTRLDNITSVTSPEVNDADSNGILDEEQLSEASQAVVNAEQAKTTVDTKLTEITADGLVTPNEKSEVDALIQTLESAKQTAQEKLNNVPNGTAGKDDLQTRLDNITSVTSPKVNDADSNGVLDTDQLSGATQAVMNAEQAKASVDSKLADVTSDGLVTPEEKAEVDALIQTLESAKQTAQEKLDSVPNGTADKTDLQTRLDNIASVTSPEVNDADNNGVLDIDQLSEADQAVTNAEQTKTTVDTKLTEITSDSLVTPEEKADVDALIQTLETVKQAAQEKLDSVPNGTAGKDELQTKLDNITSVTSPEVNDADGNGVLDTDQLSEAEQAVVNAEQAKTAVDTKVAEVIADGLVTPNEKAAVDALIQTLETAKQAAQEKLDSVPNNTEGKAELQNRLNQIPSVVSPEVNDVDSDGNIDSKQISETGKAIEDAEQAKAAVDTKLTEITADGLVTPDEKAEIDALIQTLETVKQEAKKKLDNIPNNTEGKAELQRKLDNITSVTSPEVNDADRNGVLDTDQLSEATQAIEDAEQAKAAVDTKLVEITSNGLVTPEEKADVDALIQTLETAKEIAKDKLDSVPNSIPGKDALQTRLNQITSAVSPTVTDADSNGVLDTDQLSEAMRAVVNAEQAKTAVDTKVTDVTSDGLVTPEEKAAVDQLIQALETAKQEAQEKLDSVPNSTAGKTELQNRLDQIASVVSPEVNDVDSDGNVDSQQISETGKAIEDAEQAKAAIDTKLAEVTSNGLVTPDEKSAVDALIQTLDTAKQVAKEKLDKVHDGTAGKDVLQRRLDQIPSVVSPEVNDADSNGVLDTVQLSEATQAVINAEQAKTAVDNKLTEVTADGLVTPDEKAAVDALIQTLETAKQTAKEKLDSVPDGTEGKATLQTRLDSISSVISPEVNDVDSNGVLDTEQLLIASHIIENVEQVKGTLDTKLSEITSDGLVTPGEKAEIDRLILGLKVIKQAAKDKLNTVPDSTTGKDALQRRLDNITSVTSPEINDADSNGVLDIEQLSEATEAVINAEQAKTAVDTKLTEIKADGLVTPNEKADVDALIQTLETAKQAAQEKLDSVPNIIAGKAELQARLNQITSVTSPEVNDVDSNGVLDTQQLSEAEKVIKAAESTKAAVDTKLADITSDGLVNPKEKAEIDKLIQKLDKEKQAAKDKLAQVPNGTAGKAELQRKLDQITSVTSPKVNDADSNGVQDTKQVSEVNKAIKAAESAKTAVDTKLADITSDGLVNPKEKAEIDKLIQKLDKEKQAAKDKLAQVPNGTADKAELQRRLDEIVSVTSPEVNDADSNGVQDTKQVSKISKTVKAVESTKAAVDNKLADIKSDGLVNPKEKAEIDKLIQKLDKEKQAAKDKLAQVPNGTAGKAELQRKLDQITSVTSPKVNDADSNGVLDTKQVSEAKKAIADAKAAQTKIINKIKEIRKDGLITPSEQADLDKLIEKLDSLRRIAKEKISNLPSGTANIDGLQTKLDNITSVTKVNDKDNNSILGKKQALDTEQVKDKHNTSHFDNDEQATINSKSLGINLSQFNVQNNRHNLEVLNKKSFENPNKENNFNMNLPYTGLDKKNPYAFEILFGILGLMIVYRRYLTSDKNTEH